MARAAMPEIPEAQATGETAALYAELRAAFGVPVVNYVWRSLAAAGGLAWAWPRVRAWRPALAAAAPRLRARAAEAVRREGLAPVVLPVPGAVPGAAADVVRAYGRGNSWNLLAVSMLLCGAAAPPAGSDAGDRGALPAIPPYPEHDRLPGAQRQEIARLAAAGPGRDSGVRPSLWVHLSPWPETLAAAAAVLPAMLGSEAFGRAHAALLREAPGLLGLAAGTAEGPEAALDTLRAFRGRIAEMVLVGGLLAVTER